MLHCIKSQREYKSFLSCLCLLAALAMVMFTGVSVMAQPDQQAYARLREEMVNEQIEQRGVRDARVLQAMRQVPRHEFVPARVRDLAYIDGPVPIGLEQTISQPYIVALMTEVLDVQVGHKVLEIGTGSGYQAAILRELTAEVYSIEILEELLAAAKQSLHRLGYHDIHLRRRDGNLGWVEHAPFDRIIVTAAAIEIPPLLIEQLAEGGKMVIPVGEYYQELLLVTKERGKLKREFITPVRFVPLVTEKKVKGKESTTREAE